MVIFSTVEEDKAAVTGAWDRHQTQAGVLIHQRMQSIRLHDSNEQKVTCRRDVDNVIIMFLLAMIP